VEEEKLFEARMQPSTKVQMSIEVQPSAMEMDMNAPCVIKAKRHATIMDKGILIDKKRYVEDPKGTC
jgi:hypothetical protein